MAMLRRLAAVEDVSVSDLVREAIDLIIDDRMSHPRPSPNERIAKFDAFVERYAGIQPDRDRANDEAAVDEIAIERKARRRREVPAK